MRSCRESRTVHLKLCGGSADDGRRSAFAIRDRVTSILALTRSRYAEHSPAHRRSIRFLTLPSVWSERSPCSPLLRSDISMAAGQYVVVALQPRELKRMPSHSVVEPMNPSLVCHREE